MLYAFNKTQLMTSNLSSADLDGEDDLVPQLRGYALPVFTSKAFELDRSDTHPPAYVPPDMPWLGALLDAIGSPVFPDSDRKVAIWGTDWGMDGRDGDNPDHAAYLAYVKAFTAQRMPWLIPMLDAARAIVMVSPGSYFFCVDNYMSVNIQIPELVPYTHMVPWATNEDKKAVH